jgi:hypothetical protein
MLRSGALVVSDKTTLIDKIESRLGCRLMVLFYNTEEPAFRTQLALDVMPCLREALSKLRMDETTIPLGLLLQSNGGALESPWPIVSGIRAVLRAQKNEFWVIVNETAHSAATLISISADKILMSVFGSLSPVDAQFNLNTGPNIRVGAGIEDIQGYYDLITELFAKDEAARSQAFGYLAQRIPPEILGQVQRIHELTRLLAKNMLLSRNKPAEPELIQNLVTALTKDFFSHNYHISEPECRQLGLPVETFEQETQKLADELFVLYRKRMQIGKDLTVEIPPDHDHATVIKNRAYLETKDACFVFQSEVVANRDKTAQVNDLGWKEEVQNERSGKD